MPSCPSAVNDRRRHELAPADGSSGGPWVRNFGVPARGQGGRGNKAVNRMVGVTSAGQEDPGIMVKASSVLGAPFKKIYKQACAQAPGNCARRGNPGR